MTSQPRDDEAKPDATANVRSPSRRRRGAGRYRLLLRLQRITWRPPPAIRTPLTRMLRKAAAAPDVELAGWSTPLIERGQDFGPLDRVPAAELDDARPNPVDGGRRLPRSSKAPELRCALVVDGLWAGGVCEFVMLLARHLPQEGVAVSVVDANADSVASTSRYRDQLLEAGVPVFDGSTPEKAENAFRLWAPDVVSEQGLPSAASFEAAAALGIPIVEVLHGMHPYLGGFTERHQQVRQAAARLVAVSELVRRQYLQLDPGADPRQVITIPNAMDRGSRPLVDRIVARRTLGLEDEFVIVSLGRYSLQKNVTGMVTAFGRVADRLPGAHLVVAGHAADAFHLAQAAERRGGFAASDRIHLRGDTSSPNVVLAAADAFVMDSFFEGWSLAAMDAVYAGVPLVVAEVAGASEQVGSRGERGIMVPNPVGHTGLVGWDEMRKVAYGRQANTEALGVALVETHSRRHEWLQRRSELQRQARSQFPVTDLVGSHAAVLRDAAGSRSMSSVSALQTARTAT